MKLCQVTLWSCTQYPVLLSSRGSDLPFSRGLSLYVISSWLSLVPRLLWLSYERTLLTLHRAPSTRTSTRCQVYLPKQEKQLTRIKSPSTGTHQSFRIGLGPTEASSGKTSNKRKKPSSSCNMLAFQPWAKATAEDRQPETCIHQ
ncbi:hypothetical protein ILYODFUR_021229 [Ilyodon furcidens]|uniref:Uncharacterized protein n=1 Tax=Ilyodon furcidens TaxID=33524 RepID=A0ABV0UW63_9TELE